MTAAGQTTFDGNPQTNPPVTQPYRPGPADFNGVLSGNTIELPLIDDQENPPGDPSLINAALMNMEGGLLISACAMIAHSTISIVYSSGNPIVDSFTSATTAVRTNPAASTFTIARTPGGAGSGDIFIYWNPLVLPNPVTRPKAFLNGATPGGIAVDWFSNAGNTGVRIVTVNMSNSATDLPFTVDLM